ncbi:hypothetical protein Tco_0181595, partial [Tanacetum coccineum]
LISGKVPQISHLKPFGCQVTILNTSDGYLVGYASNSKAYRVYNLPNKRVEETLNLRFLEDKPNVQGIGHEWYFDLDYLTDSLGYTRFKTDTPAGTHETNINADLQATAEILCQAKAEIRDQGVSAVKDPAGVDSAIKDPAGVDSADGVSTGSPSADSNPAVSSSVSADFNPVYADEYTLPPGQQLGSSENTT